MRIAFIGAFGGIGGIQKASALVASEMAKRHTIFYIDYRGDGEFCFDLASEVKVFEVASPQNKGRRMNLGDKIEKIYAAEIVQISGLLKQNRIDTAILNGSFCTALISFLKKELPDTRMIAWQQNSFEQYVGRYSEKYRDEYINGLGLADAVVALTHHSATLFSDLNDRSICIYDPSDIPPAMRCDAEGKQLLFVGRVAIEQKGVDLLLDAFDLIDARDWRLKIVGDGNDMNALTEMAARAKKKEHILLQGRKTGEELMHEYQSGAVFILPSRWEGLSLSLIEALSVGLPVVSTPTDGAGEVLCGGKHGLITKSFSAVDIAESIQTMIDSEKLRMHFSEQALKRVGDFSLSAIMPLWDNLLASL